MDYASTQPPAGWYPDPAGSGAERYWDGASWSHVTRASTRRENQVPGGLEPSVLAGWWARAGAIVVDAVLLAIPGYLLLQWLAPGAMEAISEWVRQVYLVTASGRTQLPPEPASAIEDLNRASLAMTAVAVLYRAFFVAWRGATPGKMLLRIQVIPVLEPTATRPDAVKALVRAVVQEVLAIGVLLPVALVSYLMPLFTARKQTLHDMVAGTIVVKKATQRSLGDDTVR